MAGFTDASTAYPCIHARKSVSKKSTIKFLQEDFALFVFLYTGVMDYVATFKSEEFLEFCKKDGIVHIIGTPYHPATNVTA